MEASLKASFLVSMGCLSLVLAGCETANFAGRSDINVTNSELNVPPPVDPADPRMQASINDRGVLIGPAGNMAPPPAPPLRGIDAIAAAPVVPVAPSPLAPAMAPPPMQSGVSMGDTSVTIFPLDGEPLRTFNPITPGAPRPLDTGRSINMNYGSAEQFAPADTVIYFKHGSSRLGSGDMQKLARAAETAKFAPVNRVKVEGHASTRVQTNDPVHSSILNLKESMNRAFAVSKTLIQKGVPAEKLQTTAYGDTKASGPEGEQRRVDVITGGY